MTDEIRTWREYARDRWDTDPLHVDEEPWVACCDHGCPLSHPCSLCEARGGTRAVALALLAVVLCLVGAFVVGRWTA